MQTIKPASNQIFAEPTKSEASMMHGLYMTPAEAPKTATVIEVGAKVTQFKKGDLIVYKQYVTTDIKLNNKEYFLIEEQDVLGTVVEVK